MSNFKAQNVSDCRTLNDVMDKIGADDYNSVDIQDHITDRVLTAANFQLGQDFADKLDDVIGMLSHEFNDYRGVISPSGETYVVSDTYDLLQPREMVPVLQPVLDQYPGHTFKRAGYLNNGRKLFIEVNIGKFDIDRKDRKVGDVLEKNITLYTGFDSSTITDISENLYRLWCSNGCASWVKQMSIRCKHTAKQRNRLAAAVGHLTDSVNVFKQIEHALNNYAQTSISHQTAKKTIERILPGKATRTVNQRDEILSQFNQPNRGTFGETVFDLFNAFTAHASHEVNYRTTTVSREENRFNALTFDSTNKMVRIVDELNTLAS